jgi:hypothetical protein
MFSSSGEGEIPTALGPLERANLNPSPSSGGGNRSSFQNAVFSIL